MRAQRRDCIGVCVSAPMEEVPLNQELFLWLFTRLYDLFGAQGQYVSFDLNPYAAGGEVDYARGLWEQRFSGCVLVGPLRTGDRTVHKVHASGHPYVALSRLDSLPECSHATVDYEAGTRMSVHHLVQRGHTRIGMLKAFSGYNAGVERRRGYLQGLEEAGLPADPRLIRRVSFGSRDIVQAVHSLLQDPSVTALIDCSAAEDADSIREGARRAGRRPGEDFEIVCWTYTDNTAILPEACGHVWLPVVEAAMDGFQQFADWFNGTSDGPVAVLYRPTLYEHLEERQTQGQTLFNILR